MIPHALTGYSVLSAAGIGRDAFEAALRAPQPLAARAPSAAVTFDSAPYKSATGCDPQLAEVPDFTPQSYLGDKGLRVLDRLTKLMLVANRLALRDAGLKQNGEFVGGRPEQIGVCSSNAYGSLEAITELDRVAKLEDARYINPAKFPNTVSNSASGYVSIWEDLRALNVAVSDGNCGGLDVFSCADLYLRDARARALMIGGAEAMSEALFLAFRKLESLAKGTRLAEAAAFIAMEPLQDARNRGAKLLAETLGYGAAFRPPTSEASLVHASCEAMAQAIRMALQRSSLPADAIDLVVSSHSGIRRFDQQEAAALADTLPPEVAVAAPKLLFGETLGASGVLNVCAALAWFSGIAPEPIVSGTLRAPLRHVLVTSLGFYGNASALVLRAPGLT